MKMKKRTTIYITNELNEEMKIFAIKHGVSTSKLIEDVMNYFVHDIVQYTGDYPEGGYED